MLRVWPQGWRGGCGAGRRGPLIPIGCGRCRWEQGRELLLERRLAGAVGGEGEETWRDSS
jgi:hypothetical protein